MSEKKPFLVVSDEAAARKMLADHLAGQGSRPVVEASDSTEALARLADQPCALVLADIDLPGRDGLWLLAEVQNRHPGTPVIMTTAESGLERAISALDRGAEGCLRRPVNAIELRHAVGSALEKRRLIAENRDYRNTLEQKVTLRTEELKKSLREIDRAREKIRLAHVEAVFRLTVTAEYREEETGGHIRRISRYAWVLARAIGFALPETEIIAQAAPMHDLGKVGIPDHILKKKTGLTPAEFEIIKTHTAIGAQILSGSRSECLQMAEQIARTHHENWDGSGYPDRRRGEAIPIAGAIVHLADVYDTLRSRRPYKPPLDHESTCRIISEGDGRTRPGHFAPAVREAFRGRMAEFRDIFAENQ